MANPRVSVVAVDRDDLGVLGQVHPGHPAAQLGRLDDVGPEPAYVDQAEPRAGGGAAAAGGSARLGAPARRLGLAAPARASRRRPARRRRLGRPAPGRGSGGRVGASAAGSTAVRRARPGGRGPAPRPRRAGRAAAIATRFSSRSSRASTPSVDVVGAGQQHPGADQLEQQPGRGGAAHLGQAGGDHVGGPAQLGRAEPGRLGDQPLALVLGDVDQAGGRGVGHRGDDHQVAQPAQQVLGEPARVLAGLDRPCRPRRTPPRRRRPRTRRRPRRAGCRGCSRAARSPASWVTPVGPGAAEQLVEHRQRVARRAGAGAHDQRQRGRLDRRRPPARRARRGTTTAAAAGSAGTGSGGCATGSSAITLSGSVVAKMKRRCGGGSSTSLSRALKPCVVTMWASSMM